MGWNGDGRFGGLEGLSEWCGGVKGCGVRGGVVGRGGNEVISASDER